MIGNHFEFDYSVVRKLDPSYERYLQHDSGPFTADDDPHGDGGATIRQVQQTTTPRRKQGLDADELAIVDMIHSENREVEPDEPHGIYEMPSHDFSGSSSSEKDDDWVLRYEYRNPQLNGAKVNPLQLMPPKSVLGGGSEILQNSQILYKVGFESHKGLAKTLSRNRFSDASDNGKLRLIHSKYWFDPIHNVASENKGTFMSLVYNIKTRRLYVRTFTGNGFKGPKSRYTAKIRGIAFNTIAIQKIFEAMPHMIYLQFVDRLVDVVLEDVPDAYIPNSKHLNRIQRSKEAVETSKFTYLTALLVLQHKLGKRIDWLDDETLFKISPLLNEAHVCNYVDREGRSPYNDELRKEFSNYRNYRLAAMRKCLKEKPGLKSLAKALFGKEYSKFAFMMLIGGVHTENLATLLASVNDGRLPKNIYHYVVRLLKNRPLCRRGLDTINSISHHMTGPNIPDRRKQLFYSCLQTYERLGEMPGTQGWQRWRDMYNMAGELHVRIRPNKFTSVEDINALHDGLSDIYNRDRRIIRQYEDVTFEPFTHPDKEYGDGFRFVFLDTPEALVHEGTTMHHCVGSYSRHCVAGDSIIFSMRKGDRSYITIELDGQTYNIKQKYTIKDHTVENQDILNMIEEWHDDVWELHKEEDEFNRYRTVCRLKVGEQEEKRKEEGRKQLVEQGLVSQRDVECRTSPSTSETDGEDVDPLETAIEAIRDDSYALAV